MLWGKFTRFENMSRFFVATWLVAVAGLWSTALFADEDAARREVASAHELYAAGNWETAKEAYEAALKEAPAGSIVETEATMELASLLWEQGDYNAAHGRAKDALSKAKALKLDAAAARLLLTLGHIEASRAQFKAAEGTLGVCVQQAKQQRDTNFEALCRINLRFVRQLQGKSVGPEAQYRRDLETLKKSGQSVLVGTSLAKSAELQEKAQDFAGALNTLRQAEAQFLAAGSLPAQARNKLRLAQALQNLNRWDEAAKELDGLVLTFRNMKNRPALVTAYALRGKQRAHAGDQKGALEDYRLARETAQALKSPHLVANTELALCEYYAVAGDSALAEKFCRSASDGFKRVGIPTLAARAHILPARLAQSKQEWLTARDQYLEALRILSEDVAASARDEREIAVQEVNLCQVEMQLKSSGAYRRCLDAAQALRGVKASDASYRGMVAATNYSIGVTAPTDQREKAVAALDAAANEWAALGNGPQAAEALLRLGKLQVDNKATRKQGISALDRGLKAVGEPTDAPRTALAIQLAIQKGQAELAQQAWAEATQTLPPLIGWAERTQDWYSAAWAYSGLAQAQLKLGQRDASIASLRTGLAHAKRAKDDELTKMLEANLEKLTGR